MKLDLFLFVFALSLAFVTGNITYFIKSNDQVDLEDLENIRRMHKELQEEVAPYKRLDLNIDFPTSEHLKLINREPNLPTNPGNIFLNSSECIKSKITQLRSSFINKESLWLAYLCNQVATLPLNFFDSPPFMHSNGSSYSYMRYKTLNTRFKRLRWLESHAKYMHITELKSLNLPTSANLRFLIGLPNDAINRVIKGDNTFISDNYYFIKNGNLKYYVINKNIAQRFFKRARYIFSLEKKACIFKIGNVCWNKKPHNLQSLFSQSTIVIFIGTLIILLITARSLFTRLRRNKLEEERKKHALRILTHELRTPIASLLLQLDYLNKIQEELIPEVRDQILKIEGQVYRLKHLAQKSESYLQTDSTSLISLNKVDIPSLNTFFEELMWEYEKDSFSLNTINDCSINTDLYWLKMCVMNLIDNALRYGKDPIEVQLNHDAQFISIKIKDNGVIPYKNLKELLNSRHHNSKGLGLGLIIVDKTLKEMGAKLILKTDPTIFEIQIQKDVQPQGNKV